MMKRKGRTRHTYMSDRYEMRYHFAVGEDDTLVKTIWEDCPFIGPEGYDLSHVDIIIDNIVNRTKYILDGGADFQEWQRKNYTHQKFRP